MAQFGTIRLMPFTVRDTNTEPGASLDLLLMLNQVWICELFLLHFVMRKRRFANAKLLST